MLLVSPVPITGWGKWRLALQKLAVRGAPAPGLSNSADLALYWEARWYGERDPDRLRAFLLAVHHPYASNKTLRGRPQHIDRIIARYANEEPQGMGCPRRRPIATNAGRRALKESWAAYCDDDCARRSPCLRAKQPSELGETFARMEESPLFWDSRGRAAKFLKGDPPPLGPKHLDALRYLWQFRAGSPDRTAPADARTLSARAGLALETARRVLYDLPKAGFLRPSPSGRLVIVELPESKLERLERRSGAYARQRAREEYRAAELERYRKAKADWLERFEAERFDRLAELSPFWRALRDASA